MKPLANVGHVPLVFPWGGRRCQLVAAAWMSVYPLFGPVLLGAPLLGRISIALVFLPQHLGEEECGSGALTQRAGVKGIRKSMGLNGEFLF